MMTNRPLRASTEVQHAVQTLFAERGEAAAVEFMEMARPTVIRLFAGVPVMPATLIAAAAKLGVDLRGTIAAAEEGR